MDKHKKRLYIAGLVIIAIAACYILAKWIARKRIEIDMQISDSSVVEVYHVPSHEDYFLVNVIDEYIRHEDLFLLQKGFFGWECTLLSDGNDIIDVVFHKWNEEVFAEVAWSTHQGNGNIDIYKLDKNSMTLVLTIGAGVDRNHDSTTGSVYENGRLFMRIAKEEGQMEMPDIVMWGTELVYGYDTPMDFSGDEMLYQRNSVEYVYRWNSEENKYYMIEEVKEVLQQVDGVYPVDWTSAPIESLKGKWKVTELAEICRTGRTYWAEETYLGRSIEISDKKVEKSI